jgi:adenylate cyclase
MRLFEELKRRNVFRVAIAYVVVAWLVLQVGETLAPALRLPESVNSVLVFFLLLGFPVVVFFAWVFEMTPDGLKLEKDVDRAKSITPVTGRRIDRIIIVLLVIAVGYFVWESRFRSGDTEAPEAVAGMSQNDADVSIAVLPFVNMSSDAEQEYFSDGLSEELLNLLAKIPDLRVTSRTSAFSFKGRKFRISEVGRELNVDHVLEGSVRKSGNRVRITAQLINVHDDAHLWSNTWDRTLDDVFVIQDEIAGAVVDALKIKLLGGAPHVPVTDPLAYAQYLQARHLITQRTDQSLVRAEQLLRDVVATDPAYAPAWTALAFVYSNQADVGVKEPNVAFALGREAVEEALRLEPENAWAHAQLADQLMSHDWDFAAAKREIDIAMGLDPDNGDILFQATVLAVVTGNPEQALRISDRAILTDPVFGPHYIIRTYTFTVLERLQEAMVSARKFIEISPAAYGAHYYLSLALIAAGDSDAALAELDKETLEGFRETGRALAWQAAGERAKSDAAKQALEAISEDGYFYQMAIVCAWRGEADEAFAWLERGYENGDTGLILLLGDHFLDNIRDDPRFDALLARLGLGN